MALTFTGDDTFRLAFTVAHAAADGEIGTEHLLHGLIRADDEVKRRLDAFDVTPVVVQSVVRSGTWAGPEGGPRDPERDVVVVAEGGKPAAFSAAARAALAHAQEQGVPLLTAILRQPGSRAATVLRDCGVDPERVVAGRPPAADRVEPDLRATRDRLIGRERYRGRGLRSQLLSFLIRVRINYALTPVLWASLEADVIARRSVRTDDILIGLLRVHAVAEAYPHLWRGVPEQYAGVRELTLDHRTAAEMARTILGDDDVPPKALLKPGDDWPRDTAALIAALRAHPGNRAARLLAAHRG